MTPPPSAQVRSPARQLAPLTVAVAVAAAALWWRLLPGVVDDVDGFWLAVALLAAGFAIAETTQIHVELKRQTVSLSLSELPLVVGLFLAAPLPLLAGRLVGALAVALVRRTVPYKASFNAALYSLEVGVLVTVAGQVEPGESGDAWLLTFVAVMVATTLSGLLLLLAVRLLQGPPQAGDILLTLAPLLFLAALNTSLALIVVVLLDREPEAAGLLLVVALALGCAYRAYSVLLRRHRSLEQVHDFMVGAAGSRSTQELVQTVLHHSRNLLSADTALLMLPGARLVGSGDVFVLREDGQVRPAPPRQAELMRSAALHAVDIRCPTTSARHRRSGLAPDAGLYDAVGLPLPSDRGEQGFLLVANHLGSMSSLNDADLRLLTVVATQLTVALQNSSLLARLRQDATHDVLTGLPNRALFHERLEDLTSRRPGGRGAVLLLDLDGFKEVNDTLGHHNGDELLREVARRLTEAVPPEVTVARIGGDEFTLLLPEGVYGGDPLQLAEQLQLALRRPCEVDGVQVDVRASLGIALFPEHGQHSAELLQRADVAMYAAKSARVPTRVYDSAADHTSPRKLALVGELRSAIEHDGLIVHYQPKVTLRDERVIGAEALVRWPHPVLGLIPPDDFVQIAEHTGLIVDLTRVVLDTALAQCRAWSDQWGLGVAVNVSPRALLAPGFVDEVRASLTLHGVPAGMLTLEVTENSVMTDPDTAIALLQSLHDLGVRLSVDDFGTGYSSLAYLQRLPVDEVKIDKGFVMALTSNAGNTAIVAAICNLSHSLGLSVVAEGLEDAGSRDLLRTLGCDVAQGYLISRPLPPDAVDEWLTSRMLAGRYPGR